jgi:hypothetical protein
MHKSLLIIGVIIFVIGLVVLGSGIFLTLTQADNMAKHDEKCDSNNSTPRESDPGLDRYCSDLEKETGSTLRSSGVMLCIGVPSTILGFCFLITGIKFGGIPPEDSELYRFQYGNRGQSRPGRYWDPYSTEPPPGEPGSMNIPPSHDDGRYRPPQGQ